MLNDLPFQLLALVEQHLDLHSATQFRACSRTFNDCALLTRTHPRLALAIRSRFLEVLVTRFHPNTYANNRDMPTALACALVMAMHHNTTDPLGDQLVMLAPKSIPLIVKLLKSEHLATSQSRSIVATILTYPLVFGPLVTRMTTYEPAQEMTTYQCSCFLIRSQVPLVRAVLAAVYKAKRRDFFASIYEAGFGRYLQVLFRQCSSMEVFLDDTSLPFNEMVTIWLMSALDRDLLGNRRDAIYEMVLSGSEILLCGLDATLWMIEEDDKDSESGAGRTVLYLLQRHRRRLLRQQARQQERQQAQEQD
ncbi:hypothetical protein BC828DRAFT_417715 [Blastocladiella britannica]|nr:hypothetical protein BC828DRAFT_417715 [Blastocladiella britannica]